MKLYICKDMTKAEWSKNTGNKKTSSVFAKKCICDFLGLEESKITISFIYNKYGKPFSKNVCDLDGTLIDISVHFSLSHSEKMIVCAVARFNIGVDCQKKNISDSYIKKCKKIAKRFYTDEENKFLDEKINGEDYINDFFEIWAKKEAYIKYTGKGLAEGLKSFSVADSEAGQKNYYKDVVFEKVKIQDYEYEDYVISLCCNRNNKDIDVLEIKYF